MSTAPHIPDSYTVKGRDLRRETLRRMFREGKSAMLYDDALDVVVDALMAYEDARAEHQKAMPLQLDGETPDAAETHAQHRARVLAAVITNDALRQSAEFMRSSGARIREERLRLGFKTQSAAAAQFGVSRKTWYRYETGRLEISRAVGQRFVDAGADYGYILAGIRLEEQA